MIFLKASLLIGLACPVEGSLSDGVARRQRTAFGWPLQTAPSFMALSLASLKRRAADEKVLIGCQQLSLSNEGMKRTVSMDPNPQFLFCSFFEKCLAELFVQSGNMLTHKT